MNLATQIKNALYGLAMQFLPKNVDSAQLMAAAKRVFVKEVQLMDPAKSRMRGTKNAGGNIINQVTVRPINRQSQDIEKWRNALIAAEGESDQRVMLYDLFSDMLLDGHLTDAIEKRIEAITNTTLMFVDKKGKPVEDVNDLVDKSFFQDFLTEVMQAKFWGHSLVELDWGAPGSGVGKTNLIPRKHVKPRLGIVTKEQWGTDGILYRDLPNVIEVGKSDDFGRLLQASQYVIYKRGGFGDWAEFAETFGTPFRWATYNNEQSRVLLEQALAQAGSAGYVVAPVDAQLQFLNANPTGQGDMLFNRLREACNEEISICILGNTMTTTEAKSSGYAQSVTHGETQAARHKSDRKFTLSVLNEMLVKYLQRIGYKVEGGKWTFVDEETIALKDRLEIDLKVADKVPIANRYWYEKYKIPVPAAGDEVGGYEEDPDPDEEEEPGEAGKKQPARKKG